MIKPRCGYSSVGAAALRSESDFARKFAAQKTAVKAFTAEEQDELIREGEAEGVTASNLDQLDIEGTHYTALEEAFQADEDAAWLAL